MTRPAEPAEMESARAATRLIVGFAGSRRGDALIDVVAIFAKALNANLKGIYVRESGLLDLADLPFTLALGPGRSTSRALSAASLEKAWLREESSYRRAIARRIGEQYIEWSRETTNVSFEACLQRAATARDIVALTAETASPATAALAHGLADLARTARAVLLVGTRQRPLRPGPVLALDDCGPAGADIVRLAEQIAGATGQSLEVLREAPIRGGSGDSAAARPFAGAVQARLHRVEAGAEKSLRNFLCQPPPSLIVANPRLDSSLSHHELRLVIERCGAPILLVAGHRD